MPLPRKVSLPANQLTNIAPFNEKRITISIFNVGSYDVYISPDQTNVRDQGFPVKAGGGIIFKKKDGDKTEYALYGIADGATEIRVWEEYE